MASYLGADPGVKGGLALLRGDYDDRGNPIPPRVDLFPFPKDWLDDPTPVWNWVLGCPKDTVGVIELVTGWMGSTFKRADGGEGSSPQAHMAKMSRASGIIEGLLLAGGIVTKRTPARVWQRALGLSRDKRPYPEWKRALKVHAESLFPRERVTAQVADALLIAEYCRMLHEGEV